MLDQIMEQLHDLGLSEAEAIVSNRMRRPRHFELLAKKWAKVVENVQKFDQFSMYTVDEYTNDIDSRFLLAEMQFFLPQEGKVISDKILGPLDEVFFRETIRIENPVMPSPIIPEKYYIFYYHIPKRENAFFLDHLRRLGIL